MQKRGSELENEPTDKAAEAAEAVETSDSGQAKEAAETKAMAEASGRGGSGLDQAEDEGG